MKANAGQIRAALDHPRHRLLLLHGPDAGLAAELSARLGKAMGDGAERVDLDGPALKADPARLADEAASMSLFGDKRWIRVTGVGEESVLAIAALLEAEQAGNPVLVIAPTQDVYQEGENRFGFGVFEVDQTPVGDADVAIYAAPPNQPAVGPFPATIESLRPASRARAAGGMRRALLESSTR